MLDTALVVDYLRRRRFWRDLEALSEQIDRAYVLSSLMERPDFLEGAVAYDALAVAGKAAADDVAAHAKRAADYREYVELWIHEVKTPIAAAGLMASDLHGVKSEKLRGELDRIERCVEQALFYARTVSFEKDFSIREFALADAVRDACRKNARFLIERGVSVSMDVADDVLVMADAKQVAFIVGQLASNAAKYGASSLRFSARVEGARAGERTVLEVADDGWGIPAADVPRVFDRGFTGSNGRAAGTSTGMGLYLVAVMCEKMGLDVGLASEEGTGTRVLVSFPHDRRRLDDAR